MIGMIVAKNWADLPPLTVTFSEELPSAEERARQEELRRHHMANWQWFGEHAKEIRDAHSGKSITIAEQELFVGNDPREVYDRACRAHPEWVGSFLNMHLSMYRGPKIYANRWGLDS
jgi:hypothetical protein